MQIADSLGRSSSRRPIYSRKREQKGMRIYRRGTFISRCTALIGPGDICLLGEDFGGGVMICKVIFV